MAAVDRNSDGSYDAVDSGGFGKDYHGQDAFGERIGGTGIGGSHFGGFEKGHVGLDKDNTGHYEKLSSEALAQTESMPKSAFEADNSNESEEEEAGSDMRDSLRDLNSESSEENSNVGSMGTGFQIGKNVEEEVEDKKKAYEDALQEKEKVNAYVERKKTEIDALRKELTSMNAFEFALNKGNRKAQELLDKLKELRQFSGEKADKSVWEGYRNADYINGKSSFWGKLEKEYKDRKSVV